MVLIVGAVGLYQSANEQRAKARLAALQSDLAATRAFRELENAKANQKQIEAALGSLTAKLTASVTSDDDRRTIQALGEQQKNLSDRVGALEGALMNDPVKVEGAFASAHEKGPRRSSGSNQGRLGCLAWRTWPAVQLRSRVHGPHHYRRT